MSSRDAVDNINSLRIKSKRINVSHFIRTESDGSVVR